MEKRNGTSPPKAQDQDSTLPMEERREGDAVPDTGPAVPPVEPVAVDDGIAVDDRLSAGIGGEHAGAPDEGAGMRSAESLGAEPATAEEAPREDNDLLSIDDRLTRVREEQALREAERRSRWRQELRRFAAAASSLPGADSASSLTPEELARLLPRLLGPLYPRLQAGLPADLRQDLLDPQVLRGLGAVLGYALRWPPGSWRRRLEGDIAVDDYGLDEAFLAAVMPLARLLYEHYWRVETSGLEHIPEQGRAMLVSNHSGVLPFDGAMISTAVYGHGDAERLPRALVANWFPTLPFVSMLLQRTGQVLASPHNALRLLEREELVVVFPEGIRGVGKLYRDRYQLLRFGRGGYLQVALRSGAPIIPVAVVGAEEIYPVMGKVDWLARLLGLPFFPITPTFPWTGPLGLVPLPSKWTIDIGPPIRVEEYGTRASVNPLIVNRLNERLRTTIQEMLLRRLAKRRSILFG